MTKHQPVLARAAIMFIGLVLVLAGVALPSLSSAAETLRGVALVVGQSAYQTLPLLPNPANDARAIDLVLSDLGFDVDTVLDGDQRRLERALARFVEDAADADVALIYYSGHGVEAGGDNFLVPVDAQRSSRGGRVDELVPVGSVLAQLQRTVPVTILLLDACRNNPYPPGTMVARSGGDAQVASTGLAVQRGAAPLRDNGRETLGTVIGFAAEPGKAALDGQPGGNSPYAAALVKHLGAGGHAFSDVMTMVAEEVYLKTASRQLPWTNASLRRLLYFGRAAEEQGGDKQVIREGRRTLLLTIAATPPDTRRLVEQVAAENAVPLDALYGMLEVLGAQGSGDLARALTDGAGRLKTIMAERDTQTRTDPEIIRLAALADEAEGEGAIGLALQFRNRASARADEIDAALDEAETNIKGRRLELSATYRSHAETAILNFDFATAAARYGDAFAQAERWDVPLSYQLKVLQGEALADLGLYRGDNGALENSLASYQKALDIGRGSPDARRDAALKGNMAIVMTQLGGRSADVAWLKQAAALYTEVVAAFPRKRFPEDWAYAQLNLGSLYQAMADRGGGRDILDAALKAYTDAAQVLTRKAAPEEWAGLQMNIGTVHARLADWGGGETSVHESIRAIEAALGIWTREVYPLNWALAQSNLAIGLRSLGTLKKDAALLWRAIAAHEAALEVTTRERQPVSWAGDMNNLGSAYLEVAQLEGDPALYRKAVDAYREARTVLTREVDPNGFATTWYNEGRALLFLGRKQTSIHVLREAQSAVRTGIDVLAETSNPVGWARGRSVEGEILAEIGRRSGNRTTLRDARNALDEARRAYAANGMGETGQDFWQKQIEALDLELAK